jgi:hypothetical protein
MRKLCLQYKNRYDIHQAIIDMNKHRKDIEKKHEKTKVQNKELRKTNRLLLKYKNLFDDISNECSKLRKKIHKLKSDIHFIRNRPVLGCDTREDSIGYYKSYFSNNKPARSYYIFYCNLCHTSDLNIENNSKECPKCYNGWGCNEDCRLSKVYCNKCKEILWIK